MTGSTNSGSTAHEALADDGGLRRRKLRARRPGWGTLLLAAVVYVPLLLTRPGQVGADTKTYLYLDPARLLSRAAQMWDPNIGMGTVTHQNIGYLWPMGPYYWLMDAIGLPDWVAQRLWLGSVLFMAGLGVRWMLRQLHWEGAGVTVASFAYALTPYVLEYAARISVILLPFAGLPWLIGLAARSLRRQDWASPAWFALVALTVGGVNATSLILVMFGPLAWFVYATFVEREVTLRQTLAAGLRITVLTAATSLWWVAGLMIQGAYGIPILRYTETYETVAAAALAPEIMRGLGYWFFYGTDGLGAWTASTVRYVESVPAIALSYLLPGLGVVAAILTRWRHRVFFASLVAVGLVLSVGAHPWNDPSPYGAGFKAWTGSDLGLSFRSTPRAAPLVVLGLAVFLGSGVAAIARRRPRAATPVAAALIALICLNQMPLFLGQMVDRNLVRDEQVPTYWTDAAAALSEGDPATRIYEVPGIDFAAYRWGNTVDPITPGLTDREYVARELIPYGSPASAELLNAIEAPFQSGHPDPDVWAPIAQMMGVGQIVLRADTQYERYRTPRPRLTFDQLNRADGLSPTASFGDPAPNEADGILQLDDEVELAIPSSLPDPSPVEVFDVDDPRPVLRSVDATAPQLLAGDAHGLVALSSVGALAVDRPLFFSATFAGDPDVLDRLIGQKASTLIVTDTNRRQATRWASVRDNDGATERAGEKPLRGDLTDNRLLVFPDEGDDERSVVEQRGGATVAASAYGNNVTYTAGDRAVKAVDGDPTTGWKVGAFDDPTGEFLELSANEPVSTDHIQLLQNPGLRNRWISDVSLSFDGSAPLSFALDDSSRSGEGQTLTFPRRSFATLRVTIERTDPADALTFRGLSDVGFAEVTVPGVGPIDEVVRPPLDLLGRAGSDSLDHDLFYVFTRRGGNGIEPDRSPEEPTLRRWVESPVDRQGTAYGRARLHRWLPDERVDDLIGWRDASAGGVTARSSARLPGDLRSRASATVDGDGSTAYQTPIQDVREQWVELTYPAPVTLDEVALDVLADGRHSIPTVVTLSVDGAPADTVTFDAEHAEGTGRAKLEHLSAPIAAVTGTTFRFTIDDIEEVRNRDWFSGSEVVLPVGIAQLGVPQLSAPDSDSPMPDACRDDLLTLDGTPVPLRVDATVGEALSGDGMDLVACGSATPITAGRALLESADGGDTGLDLDTFALSSAAGGAPGVDTLQSPVASGPTPPETTTERVGRNHHRVSVTDASDPYWVVLGQSWSTGFRATTSEGRDLGEPTLINGYANGWLIDPGVDGADVTVDIVWAPQRLVWIGLALSGIAVALCLFLVTAPMFGSHRSRSTDTGRALAGPLPARPVHVAAWFVDGDVLAWPSAVVATLCAGAGGAMFGAPVLGLVMAILTLAATRLSHGQLALRAVAVGAFGAAAAYIVAKQFRYRYVADFDWVARFEPTHGWVLLAVFALMAATVVDGLRARGSTPEE